MNRSGVRLSLAALLATGLAARLAVLPVPGHGGDVSIIAGWAERMAEVGPLRFYEASGAIYPALLYPLWLLGSLLDGDALAVAIKALSIPFDLALGAVLFVIGRSLLDERRALGAAAAYVLNPAVVLAGPVWGQVDAAGTLALVAALAMSAAGRDAAAGALAAIATLLKPQFGLAVPAVLVVATARARGRRSRRPLVALVAGGLVAYAAIAVPLILHPLRALELFLATAGYQPSTSLNAFNPWGLMVGFKVPDGPYVGIGTALLVVGLAATLLLLRSRRDLWGLLAVGALMAIAFYFLPTRVHERYLFPAIALLAPFSMLGARWMAAYAAISLGFAASLVYALHTTTPFDVPAPMAGALVSPVGVWAIGIVLIGSAVVWCWLLVGVFRGTRSSLTEPRRQAEEIRAPSG